MFHHDKCHECGLPIDFPSLAERQKAVCPRCNYTLSTKYTNAVDRTLAFSITALIFLLLSLFFDFLTFRANGIERTISLITSLEVLAEQDFFVLALLLVLSVVVIPCLILLSFIYLLTFVRQQKFPPFAIGLSKFIHYLLPWHMAEIFIISTLVSLIKIVSLADIELGLSFYTFITFSVTLIAALLHFDQRQLFEQLTEIDQHRAKLPMKVKQPEIVVRQKAIQRTWALLMTSLILYIPANTFPIMNTRLFGQDDPSTIIGGVFLLWQHGSYPIAIIIFIASIIVPLTKIAVLAWLNYSVQVNSGRLLTKRIKWYRVAEFVGRWSMIDVFVVIILVSLVQLGDSMMVLPGYATIAFLSVVILTMLAAMTFDSTLIYKGKDDRA